MTGKYAYLQLSQRPKHRKMPALSLHDTRGKTLTAGLSSALLGEIKTELARGKQCMVFLNRRGFAPALFCTQCGWRAYCQACDKPMTYHASTQKAVCHHCDHTFMIDQHCPDCQQTSLSTQGQGTERIAFALQNQFPNVPVIRIDRDTTRKKGEIETKLNEVRQGSACILVGTQMLAKGHDFPNITLVGILEVDQALFSMDYRAPERLAQLITQVAGRAGRGADSGRVMLQTCQPDHPALQTLLYQDYRVFAEQLLAERQQWQFPPYSYQALIRTEALTMDAALQFLSQIRELLQAFDLQLLGPAPAPLERRATWYRAQLLITASQRKHLHHALSQRLNAFYQVNKRTKLRWSIDIDPVDLS
ncbi:MAG TPA: primosomal protein N' [Thiothrix sp.]|nr:primosomal protein N' [Thiothrix sp.]